MKTSIIAVIVLAAVSSSSAFAGANEQVFDAEITNNVQTCSIDYAQGSQHTGSILTEGETQSSAGKGVSFDLKTNAPHMSWQITEAKITQNTGKFSFADNLIDNSKTAETSLVVNDQDYAWSEAKQAQTLASNSKHLTLAPKINMAAEDLPTGTTHIQGKIRVTCSL